MADVFASAQSSVINTGTAKKTMVQLLAATNTKVKIKEISVSFNGTSNTAEPVLCEVARQDDAGTMDTLSPNKLDNQGDTGTFDDLLTTALEDASVEPSEDRVLVAEHVHPQGGWTWQPPFGADVVLNSGGRIGLAITAPAAVDAVVRFIFEE